jgi:FkbM family methyltransferase
LFFVLGKFDWEALGCMMAKRTHLEIRESIYGNPLFPAVRTCYQAVFKYSALRDRRAMRNFYRQFFAPKDLVFDVGANIGEYADIFASAGATVVAVEPNPVCCQQIYKLAGRRPIRVECCAVSDQVGTVELQVCDQSIFSTINRDWVERTRDFPSYKNVQWTDSLTVPMVTLDNLVRRHGKPAFVKIDVEGLEDKVLSALSSMPNFVSFEYNVRLKHVALRSIELPLLSDCLFNAIEDREFRWIHAQWKTRAEITDWLKNLSVEKNAEYGDLFAKRIT